MKRFFMQARVVFGKWAQGMSGTRDPDERAKCWRARDLKGFDEGAGACARSGRCGVGVVAAR